MFQQPFDHGNPYRTTLLKYAQQLVGEKYGLYHDILMRTTSMVITQKDAEEFSHLLLDLYQAGFMKAVNDYRPVLEKYGLRVEIKSEQVN